MTSQLVFLNISTFLPIHLQEHCDIFDGRSICLSDELDSGDFAVILAMYNTARLLLSTYIGSNMNRVGRKNYIMIGFVLMIVSTSGFGLLAFIPAYRPWLFFWGALISRFIQGIGGTCL